MTMTSSSAVAPLVTLFHSADTSKSCMCNRVKEGGYMEARIQKSSTNLPRPQAMGLLYDVRTGLGIHAREAGLQQHGEAK